MTFLLITYFAIILIAILISLSSWKKIVFNYQNNYNKKNPEKWVEENFGTIDVAELKKIKPLFVSQIKNWFTNIFVIINLPVFLLKMALIARYGIKILWKLPFQFYDIWWIFIYVICFNKAQNGSAYLALIISSIITISIIVHLTSNLESKDGRLKIQDKPEHKVRIYDLISDGFLITVGFACLYFSLSIINPGAFNSKISIIDSLFYSLMVGTTMGFGYIYPVSDSTKILTMIEGFLGFMFIVIMIAVFINVWIGKRTNKEI